MTLFIDVENKKLVQSLTSDRNVPAPVFMQGDNEPLEIFLLQKGRESLYEVKPLVVGTDFLRVAIARFKGYLRDMQANAKVIHSHFIHVRRTLEVLVESFGERQVEDITRDELEGWLKNLPYAPITVKNYRSCLCATWRWFEKHELVSKNVAKLIDCPNIEMGEIGILTVEETERLLRTNEKIDPEVCGLMALGLFAGMRTSAIARVAYDEITM